VGFLSWRFKTTGVSRFVVLSGHKKTQQASYFEVSGAAGALENAI